MLFLMMTTICWWRTTGSHFGRRDVFGPTGDCTGRVSTWMCRWLGASPACASGSVIPARRRWSGGGREARAPAHPARPFALGPRRRVTPGGLAAGAELGWGNVYGRCDGGDCRRPRVGEREGPRPVRAGHLQQPDIRRTRVRAVAGTGAVMLALPEDVAERLGAQEVDSVACSYADGRRGERPFAGPLTVHIGDGWTYARCVVIRTGADEKPS